MMSAMLMAATPMVVAGGALDPAYPGAEIYLETPQSATPPPGPACEAARRYVELVNAGDFAPVAALYADDAFVLEPMRRTIRGRAEIDAFYSERIARMKPQLIPVSYLGNERECMVALANRIEIDGKTRYALVSIDQFIVNSDGKVASMVAYARPARE